MFGYLHSGLANKPPGERKPSTQSLPSGGAFRRHKSIKLFKRLRLRRLKPSKQKSDEPPKLSVASIDAIGGLDRLSSFSSYIPAESVDGDVDEVRCSSRSSASGEHGIQMTAPPDNGQSTSSTEPNSHDDFCEPDPRLVERAMIDRINEIYDNYRKRSKEQRLDVTPSSHANFATLLPAASPDSSAHSADAAVEVWFTLRAGAAPRHDHCVLVVPQVVDDFVVYNETGASLHFARNNGSVQEFTEVITIPNMLDYSMAVTEWECPMANEPRDQQNAAENVLGRIAHVSSELSVTRKDLNLVRMEDSEAIVKSMAEVRSQDVQLNLDCNIRTLPSMDKFHKLPSDGHLLNECRITIPGEPTDEPVEEDKVCEIHANLHLHSPIIRSATCKAVKLPERETDSCSITTVSSQLTSPAQSISTDCIRPTEPAEHTTYCETNHAISFRRRDCHGNASKVVDERTCDLLSYSTTKVDIDLAEADAFEGVATFVAEPNTSSTTYNDMVVDLSFTANDMTSGTSYSHSSRVCEHCEYAEVHHHIDLCQSDCLADYEMTFPTESRASTSYQESQCEVSLTSAWSTYEHVDATLPSTSTAFASYSAIDTHLDFTCHHTTEYDAQCTVPVHLLDALVYNEVSMELRAVKSEEMGTTESTQQLSHTSCIEYSEAMRQEVVLHQRSIAHGCAEYVSRVQDQSQCSADVKQFTVSEVSTDVQLLGTMAHETEMMHVSIREEDYCQLSVTSTNVTMTHHEAEAAVDHVVLEHNQALTGYHEVTVDAVFDAPKSVNNEVSYTMPISNRTECVLATTTMNGVLRKMDQTEGASIILPDVLRAKTAHSEQLTTHPAGSTIEVDLMKPSTSELIPLSRDAIKIDVNNVKLSELAQVYSSRTGTTQDAMLGDSHELHLSDDEYSSALMDDSQATITSNVSKLVLNSATDDATDAGYESTKAGSTDDLKNAPLTENNVEPTEPKALNGHSNLLAPDTPSSSAQSAIPPASDNDEFDEADNDEDDQIFRDGQILVHIRAYEKRSEGINAYLVYKIETRVTNIPNYSKPVSEVWRRFSDFLGLRDKLVEKHQNKGVAIPLAPQKSLSALTKTKLNTTNDEHSTTDVAEKRARLLERFLRRLVRSPLLVIDCDVVDFLTLDANLPKATSTAALSSKSMQKIFKSFGDVLNKIAYPMDENDRWYEQMHGHVEELNEMLVKLHAIVDQLVAYRRELAASSESLSKSLSMIASCEENTSLARTLSKLAETHDNLSVIQKHEADTDSQVLAEAIQEHLHMTHVLRELFFERVKAWQNWQTQRQTLAKKREAKARFDLAGKADRSNIARAEVQEQEQKVDQMEREFDQMSKRIRKEYIRLCKERRHDLRQAFTDYLESLVESEQRVLEHWEKFAPEVQTII